MSIKAVLFDLDGTLLPLDNDEFEKAYFGAMAKKMAPLGFAPDVLVKGVWGATYAMIKNDGRATNEDVFWAKFSEYFGSDIREKTEEVFNDFYRNEFDAVKAITAFQPLSRETVKLCKELGLRVILATNPLFPKICTDKRIKWAGLDKSDFELVTVYENSSYCKPNPDYYQDILTRQGLKAEECLMVGNDATEDTSAKTVGIDVFIVTDCLINKKGVDISQYPNGDFNALMDYIKERV